MNRKALAMLLALSCLAAARQAGGGEPDELPEPPTPTREFEVRGDRVYLGGQPLKLWGLRCVHALRDQAITERLVRNLDNFTAHGLNLISTYMQPAHGGYPDMQAGINPFTPDGALRPGFAHRLEWLAREADRRGMVILLGIVTPIKDQEFKDEAAIRRAIEETARVLESRKLRNVVVDLMYEFDHPDRIDQKFLQEPDGPAKKSRAAAWFHAIAPKIEVGVTTEVHSKSPRDFDGMDLRLIQKTDPVPAEGYTLNIECNRRDTYGEEGIFEPEEIASIIAELERYEALPNAGYVFNNSFSQSIGGATGTGPHFEMGGYGTGPGDRGIRFYYDWVRDHAGRWEYPRHVRVTTGNRPR